MEGEQLFLMEFLVEKVNIPAIRAIYEDILPAKTCVSFQILGLPPLNICQETPTEACACINNGPQIFNKGKSCLFALPNVVLQKPLSNFPVTMSVYKELPPGVLPDVMLIGTHQIQTRDLINSLLRQQVFKTGNDSETTKGTFKITTTTGQCVGEATVFIRASCFGKKIVTQFQIADSEKPCLFKGADDGPVFQCKRVTSASEREPTKCVCPIKKTGDGSGEAARICCPTADQCQRRESGMDVKREKCPPCCRVTQDTFRSKEIVRECGCVVKEEKRSCSCTRAKRL